MYLAAKELGVTISDLTDDTWVIGQNVCPFWLVFLCGGGRSSCSSCMGGELEVGQNVCPEWPVVFRQVGVSCLVMYFFRV